LLYGDLQQIPLLLGFNVVIQENLVLHIFCALGTLRTLNGPQIIFTSFFWNYQIMSHGDEVGAA
jgi:hypothetical protein